MQKIKSVLSSHSDDSNTTPRSSSGSDPRMSSSSATSHGTGNPSGQLPVREGVKGRAEETGSAGPRVTGETPGFTDPHSIGHDRSKDVSNNFDLKSATHDHKHLSEKIHDHHHTHQTEEVERQKVHERNVHHVQHHVQPVHDEQQHATKHTQNVIPETHIHEKHGSTKEDIAAFHGLHKHKDETHDHGVQRTVVDRGETVDERVHHHVHNVVQPIVKTDHHHHEVIHTVIPTKHVTHEAPTVHESLEHAPVSKADFLKQGGSLGSGISHHESGVLTEGGCDREVDGVGEKLAAKLGLKSGTVADQHKGDTRI